MDQEASSAGFGSTRSRSLERAADLALIKLLAVVAMAVVNAPFMVAIYHYWFDLRLVLLCGFFDLFYAVVCYRRWLRNRRPVLRRGLTYAAVFLGMGLLLLFFYSFATPRTPWWLTIFGLLLLPVAAYYLYRFLVHHLELEDEEAVQLQLSTLV